MDLFPFLYYNQSLGILETDVCQEAKYIEKAIEITGTQYLEELDEVRCKDPHHKELHKTERCFTIPGDDESTLDNTKTEWKYVKH